MAYLRKSSLLLTLFQLVLVFFGTYLALSLFEVWAFFPFWIKNVALLASLIAIYILARVKLTNPSWQPRLLHGLSVLTLIGLMAGFFYAGPGTAGRLGQALTLTLKAPPTEVLLTITVNPPDYLALEPVVVFSEQEGPVDRRTVESPLTFPEGSIIEVEILGADGYLPYVTLGAGLGRQARQNDGIYVSQHLLQENSLLDIQVGPYIAYRQMFEIRPDESPTVEVLAVPELSPRNSLELTFTADDDYGIEEVYLTLYRRSLLAMQTDRIRLPYFDTQSMANHYINLLSHPWAGGSVIGTITVVDGLGQETNSEEFTVLLPEKTFQNPLSQRLISIRKALIVTPERRNAQIKRLDVLTSNETAFEGNKGVYLALRSAYWRLRSAETEKDIDEVGRFLWQAALTLEDDGSLEEQRVFDILNQMTNTLSAHSDLKKFKELSSALETRLEDFFDIEFKLFSKRLSLESNIQRIDIPAFQVIRGLIEKMQIEVNAGDTAKAMATLADFKGRFEELAVSSYSQATN